MTDSEAKSDREKEEKARQSKVDKSYVPIVNLAALADWHNFPIEKLRENV